MSKSNGNWSRILISLGAMVLTVIVLTVITMRWIKGYTLHGQYINVPDVCGMYEADADRELSAWGLHYEVSDVRFEEGMEPGQIIEQRPKALSNVKPGRTVYLAVNSGNQPMKAIPDLADNSSLRAAQAQLSSMGFSLDETEYVSGDKDWVFGVKLDGRELRKGEMVPEGSRLTIVAGNGEEDLELAPADSSEMIQTDFFDSDL